MTDCCLFVCCRPRTFVRLVENIYPAGSTGFETDIEPTKLNRLCDYAKAYPAKIDLICEELLLNIETAIFTAKFGYAKIGVEAFCGLVNIASTTDLWCIVGPHLQRVLFVCLSSSSSCIHRVTCDLFHLYTQQGDKCDISQCMQPIIRICTEGIAKNTLNADEQIIGLEMLLNAIEVLVTHPGSIEKYLFDLVGIVYHYFSAQRVYFVNGADKSNGVPRSPSVLSMLCLVKLGSISCPRTQALLFAALFTRLDATCWEPVVPAFKAIDLLMASSIVVNTITFPLCSMLISHARNIANNPFLFSKHLRLDSFLPIIAERRILNVSGSEQSTRSAELRINIILKVLTVATSLSHTMSTISSSQCGDSLPKTYMYFNRMCFIHDMEHIIDIMLFSALNSNGSALYNEKLPFQSFACCFKMMKEQHVDELHTTIGGQVRSDSPHCLVLMACLSLLGCITDICTIENLSFSKSDSSNSFLAHAFQFVHNLPDRFQFICTRNLSNGDEKLENTVGHSVHLCILQALNIVLSRYALAQRSTRRMIKCVDLTSSLNGFRYLLSGSCASVNVIQYLDEKDLLSLLSVLESQSVELFQIAASCIIHLLEIFFHSSEQPLSIPLLSLSLPRRKQKIELHVFLTCLYDSFFRDLVIFDDVVHSERIATNWIIQKHVVQCIGVKELAYGVPRITAIFEFWKSFEFMPSVQTDSGYSFYHCVELLSSQILYVSVYFRFLAKCVDSPDLSLTSVQFERDCLRIFPTVPVIQGERSKGRRLVIVEGVHLALDRSAPSTAPTIFDPNGQVSDVALNEIYRFIRSRSDIQTIFSCLLHDIGSLLRKVFCDIIGTSIPQCSDIESDVKFINQFLEELKQIKNRSTEPYPVDRWIFEPLIKPEIIGAAPTYESFDLRLEAMAYIKQNVKEGVQNPVKISAKNIFNPNSMLPNLNTMEAALCSAIKISNEIKLVDESFRFCLVSEANHSFMDSSFKIPAKSAGIANSDDVAHLDGVSVDVGRSHSGSSDENAFDDTLAGNIHGESLEALTVRKKTSQTHQRGGNGSFTSPAIKSTSRKVTRSSFFPTPIHTSSQGDVVSVGSAAWSAVWSVFKSPQLLKEAELPTKIKSGSSYSRGITDEFDDIKCGQFNFDSIVRNHHFGCRNDMSL